MFNKKFAVFIAIVFACFFKQAAAYNPDIGHHDLSSAAVDLYNHCFAGNSIYNNDAMKQRVVHGDKAMDLGFSPKSDDDVRDFSPFSLLLRPFNWHFYSIERQAYSKKGLVTYSHENLWNGLLRGFGSNVKPYNKALFLGGLMHLVEDVTVPAHVVPVYHGPTAVLIYMPFSAPEFVNYMVEHSDENKDSIKDKIDEFPVDNERLLAVFKKDMSICARVAADKSLSISEIRDQTLTRTLNLLKEEIPNCPNVYWKDFYENPTGTQYFGKYNIKNTNPLFGHPGLLTATANNAACVMQYDDIRYKNFVFRLHKSAIAADMRALQWGQLEMAKP